MIFTLLCLVSLKSNTVKDTVRTPLTITSDNKAQITKIIMNSFMKNKFDTLVIFMSFNVEFYSNFFDNNTSVKIVTDYGAISELNDLFRALKYEKITALIFTNEYKTEIIKIGIFCCAENAAPDLEAFFLLDRNQEINAIMVKNL